MRSWSYPVLMMLIPLILATLVSCNECNDCGPSQNYPFVKVRFYNIDSLVRIEQSMMITEDSLDRINVLIDSGAVEYIPVRDELLNYLAFLDNISDHIQNGKIRIEEITGMGTDKSFYFRDSLSHDSLTVFNFPLSMHEGISDFIIRLPGRSDTLSVSYSLETRMVGESILRQAFGITAGYFTYDSLNISCTAETCPSNATTISVYF